MADPFSDAVHTALWQETADPAQPFQAQVCRAAGYDVYGDLIGKASLSDYLWLLLRGERPAPAAARAFNALAVALANPGPRSPSVHAAMAAGASGATAAASLIAALATGAGSYDGSREVFLCMQAWEAGAAAAWEAATLDPPAPTRSGIWPASAHPPGFEPAGQPRARPAGQTLDLLAALLPHGRLAWLAQRASVLEDALGCGLALNGVAAAALLDLGFDAQAGELVFLLLRLPGAAAHALEQRRQGYRQFPFFNLELSDDPDRR
ncbi:MAG: citryl-CoA lyase [Telluria sp.]